MSALKTLKEILTPNFRFCDYWDEAGATYYPPWQTVDNDNPYSVALGRVDSATIDDLLIQEFGDRPASYLLLKCLDASTGDVQVPQLKALAGKVLTLYYAEWQRLTADYTAQYDPVQNYNMTEHGTDDTDKAGVGVINAHSKELAVTRAAQTGDISYSETGADYEVKNRPVGSTTTQSVSTYETDNKEVSTTSTQYDAPDNNEGYTKESGVHGTSNDYKDSETKVHDFQRSGNIGVMTATDMIKNDSEFWSSHEFFQQIASDVASIITEPYYE